MYIACTGCPCSRFDAPAALQEFHRILRTDTDAGKTGMLVVAWNDRDLSVDWMRDYEALVEVRFTHAIV